MRIVSWNVNSIRARLPRLLAYLKSAAPDILCLQELKCLDDQFPAQELKDAGYQAAWHGQKTYNGVAILSRWPLEQVLRGLNDHKEDPQCRTIAATVHGVRVISVYVPNGQEVGSLAYQYKLEWFDRLSAYLKLRHKPDEPLVLCGDFNVAPDPLDVHDPQAWEGQTLFSPPEREKLSQLLTFGLQDTFRLHHPNEPGRYSWWDYRMLGFPKNHGLRIDHVFASKPMAQRCHAAGIDREERKGKQPSDHAPVWAEFAAEESRAVFL